MSDYFSLGDLGYPTADTVRRAQAYHDILTDLIAELRRCAKGYANPRAYAITVEQQREMADAAEARLREVGWRDFEAASLADGKCPHSGLPGPECKAGLCDCFDYEDQFREVTGDE